MKKAAQLLRVPVRFAASMSTAAEIRPVETCIRNKLASMFQPMYLDVINESYIHSVPKGSETHFKVVLFSEKFHGLAPLKRHRLVNDALKEELAQSIHALSIQAKTPEQWEASDKKVESSPACGGGFGK